MCGGGGSQDYGDLAGGIAGMFASSPRGGMAAGSVPAPTMQGDTTSGIGGFMPMQTGGFNPQSTGLGSGSYMTQQTPSYAAESLYSPEAAAQARLASMPQTQAMSVAELTPNATAAAAAPEPVDEEAQMRRMYESLGYTPVSQLRLRNTTMPTSTFGRDVLSRPTFQGGLFGNQQMVYLSPYEAQQLRIANMP